MSKRDPADISAFRQLEQLVRGLGEELSAFRRRALQAEARVKALEAAMQPGNLFTEQRVVELEREVADLRQRLDYATGFTKATLERLRFLRQQQRQVSGNGGGER